jgi:pilus assembly protein CpaB
MGLKTIVVLALSLCCGIAASIGFMKILAERGDQAQQTDMAPICLAKTDISAGAAASDDLVKVEQWPKDKIPAQALVRHEDVAGRRARCKIFSGQPIVEPMLVPRGEALTDAEIPKGMRVAPIPVSAEAIHSGLVVPGSHCDVQVFIRANANLGIPETLSKTILQDIRVFAVNDVKATEPNAHNTLNARSKPDARTVSLLVTPAQVEILTLASQLGSIKLILRSAEDGDQRKSKPTRPQELLGEYASSTRNKETLETPDSFRAWVEVLQKAVRSNATPAVAQNRSEQSRPHYTVRVLNRTEPTDVLLLGTPGRRLDDEQVWTAMNLPPRSSFTR